jgi:hypothetical protein
MYTVIIADWNEALAACTGGNAVPYHLGAGIDAAKHIKAQTLLDAAKHIKEHPSTAAHHAAPVPTANTRVRGTAPTVLIKIV